MAETKNFWLSQLAVSQMHAEKQSTPGLHLSFFHWVLRGIFVSFVVKAVICAVLYRFRHNGWV